MKALRFYRVVDDLSIYLSRAEGENLAKYFLCAPRSVPVLVLICSTPWDDEQFGQKIGVRTLAQRDSRGQAANSK